MSCVQALRAKRTAEQLYEEAISRVNELTTINVNLASAKSKVEQELATLAGDYDEVTRELKVCLNSKLIASWITVLTSMLDTFSYPPKLGRKRGGGGKC